MPQSAAGDLILLFGIFDVSVILRADDFSHFSPFLGDANNLRAWFLLIGLVNVILWMIAVFRIERGLQFRQGWFGRSASRAISGYLAISMIAIITNTAAFTVGA